MSTIATVKTLRKSLRFCMARGAYLLSHSGKCLDYAWNCRPLIEKRVHDEASAQTPRLLSRPRAPERTPEMEPPCAATRARKSSPFARGSWRPHSRPPRGGCCASACADAAQAQRAHEQQASDQTGQNGDQQAEHGGSYRNAHTARYAAEITDVHSGFRVLATAAVSG